MRVYQYVQAMLCLVFLSFPFQSSLAETLNLAVANSTCKAIKQVGEMYTKETGISINYLCKSSGRLAKGLNGNTVQADIYISANKKWMDFMIEHGLVDARHVISPWGNKLAVAVPASSSLHMEDWQGLAGEDVKTILLGDPGTAPFGRYAKEALKHTGLWSEVREKIVTKKHITLLADTLAESDANTVGILFVSNVSDKLKIIYLIDESWHSPIYYFMGPVGNATEKPEVMDFISFIQGEKSIAIFSNSGFRINIE
jgi:molybdate transport system substrate-binding protein